MIPGVCLAVLGMLLAAVAEVRHSRERARLLNAVMASIPHAAVAFRTLERKEPKPGKEKPEPLLEQLGFS